MDHSQRQHQAPGGQGSQKRTKRHVPAAQRGYGQDFGTQYAGRREKGEYRAEIRSHPPTSFELSKYGPVVSRHCSQTSRNLGYMLPVNGDVAYSQGSTVTTYDYRRQQNRSSGLDHIEDYGYDAKLGPGDSHQIRSAGLATSLLPNIDPLFQLAYYQTERDGTKKISNDYCSNKLAYHCAFTFVFLLILRAVLVKINFNGTPPKPNLWRSLFSR